MIQLAVTALLVSLIAAPAAAAEPSLSITLDNASSEVRPGDEVQYLAVFENTGGSHFDGIASLTPPPFLVLEAEGAIESGGELRWQVSLAPGERFEVTARAAVGADVGTEYQVVMLASLASADAPAVVLVRAADADRIAGTVAPDPVPGMQEPATPFPWTAVLAAGGVLAVLAVALAVVFRRRFTGRSAAR